MCCCIVRWISSNEPEIVKDERKTMFRSPKSQSNCGTLSRSTCTDANTTEWNKESVGKSLKKWILSINKIRSMPLKEKDTYFLRKTVLQFEPTSRLVTSHGTRSGVQYIANKDCTRKRHIGPTWRKMSNVSGTQFHDGFLYGIEDGDGELTG